MSITTVDDAIERLIDQQLADGGIPTQPARSDTLETDAGWAFFNANGYLGTVTEQGEVIDEPQFAETE